MISIIVARAANGVIGGDNKLLWHIPEDLRRFKAITLGHPVVMGRKTFESLGRALPGRRNVVITRNPSYRAEGAEVVGSLTEALSLFDPDGEVFIVGGGEIYRQAMPHADKLYITTVCRDYEGDVSFPEIDPSVWREIYREEHSRGQKFPHGFVYTDYVRR